MKEVIFQQLSVKNFFSIGNDPVIIQFQSGITTITGRNLDKEDRRNGLGKTTLCNAFYTAIFGKPLDPELKKELCVNNITNKPSELTLSFVVNDNGTNTNYKIWRTLGPSKCYLYKNGIDVTLDSIKSTDDAILQILNANSDIFKNCVIMTANNSVPFMAKSKVEKRKFIEGIFDLEIFSKMLSDVRDDFNAHKKVHDLEYAKLEQMTFVENNIKDKINNAKAEKNRKIAEIQQKITKLEGDKARYTQILSVNYDEQKEKLENKVSALISDVKKQESYIDKIIIGKSTVNATVNVLKTKISNVKSNKDICDACLRPITDHNKAEIEQEVAKLQEKLRENEEKLQKLGSSLQKHKEKKQKDVEKLSNLQDSLNITLNNIRNLQDTRERLKDVDNNIINLSADMQSITENSELSILLSETLIKKSEIQEKVNGEQRQLGLLDVAKFVLSEEGVKSYIVHKMLDLFNNIIAQYLQKLDANCLLYFNEFFEEELINKNNKICSYYNFSSAERKAIDLACWFAFNDIRRLQGNVSYNVSFYDELLDSSIDEKGLKYVIDILHDRIKKYNECTMIISHRKENARISDSIIFLEKHNDITKRVDPPIEIDNYD